MDVHHRTRFATTRWSLVVAAGGTTSPRSCAALSDLCTLYRSPVYAFILRGRTPDEAEDLTQGFFTDLLERKDLGAADPQRGRFRNWLLGCAKNYLANRHDHDTAQKRGGGIPAVALDAQDAEGRCLAEPVDGVTPEQLYVRRWAMLLLERVLGQLREEKVRAGTVARFDLLMPYLVDQGDESYASLGEKLEIKENAVKQAVHHLREQFRDRLRIEIAGTVVAVEDIDEEIRQLLAALT